MKSLFPFPLFVFLTLYLLNGSVAFQSPFILHRRHGAKTARSALYSTAPTLTPKQHDKRQTLLCRDGPYFKLDRFGGKVEFGSTANLVTQLSTTPALDDISAWLSDERRVAKSIWDPNLISERGNSMYTLQVMQLQFVTMTLAPTVDVKMWISSSDSSLPVFELQSLSYNPNLQLLPGVGINTDSLGIVIHVVGNLSPTNDGLGVSGKIAFESGGELPPPMRVLPEQVLKGASDAICDTVTKFAVQSFQRGAIANYKEFSIHSNR